MGTRMFDFNFNKGLNIICDVNICLNMKAGEDDRYWFSDVLEYMSELNANKVNLSLLSHYDIFYAYNKHKKGKEHKDFTLKEGPHHPASGKYNTKFKYGMETLRLGNIFERYPDPSISAIHVDKLQPNHVNLCPKVKLAQLEKGGDKKGNVMCKEKVEDHLREQGYLKYVKNAFTTACNAEFRSYKGIAAWNIMKNSTNAHTLIMDDDPNTLLQMFSDIQELAKRLREQLCETFSIDTEDMDMHKQVSALMEYFEPNRDTMCPEVQQQFQMVDPGAFTFVWVMPQDLRKCYTQKCLAEAGAKITSKCVGKEAKDMDTKVEAWDKFQTYISSSGMQSKALCVPSVKSCLETLCAKLNEDHDTGKASNFMRREICTEQETSSPSKETGRTNLFLRRWKTTIAGEAALTAEKQNEMHRKLSLLRWHTV